MVRLSAGSQRAEPQELIPSLKPPCPIGSGREETRNQALAELRTPVLPFKSLWIGFLIDFTCGGARWGNFRDLWGYWRWGSLGNSVVCGGGEGAVPTPIILYL